MIKTGISGFLLAIAIISTGVNATSTEVVVPEKQLFKWGYRSVNLKYPADYCDKDIAYRVHRNMQSIRSIRPVKSQADTYYRYTLIRETYSSQQAAKERLENLRLPSHKDIMYSKTCELLYGFQHLKNVYLIHTDVYAFSYDEKNRILMLFKNHVELENRMRHINP